MLGLGTSCHPLAQVSVVVDPVTWNSGVIAYPGVMRGDAVGRRKSIHLGSVGTSDYLVIAQVLIEDQEHVIVGRK